MLCPWHVEISGAGTEHELQQWQHQVLNLLYHLGTPTGGNLTEIIWEGIRKAGREEGRREDSSKQSHPQKGAYPRRSPSPGNNTGALGNARKTMATKWGRTMCPKTLLMTVKWTCSESQISRPLKNIQRERVPIVAQRLTNQPLWGLRFNPWPCSVG